MTNDSNTELIAEIQKNWSLQIDTSITEDDLVQILANEINQLIDHDFPRLISLLYRIDVSEKKLKTLLKENPKADAGIIIAHLILDRQKEKGKSREQFRSKGGEVSGEERW